MPAQPRSPSGRPYVVAHTAVALDGATTGFEPDQGLFYRLAAGWNEDVTLAGADTILAQEPALAAAPRPGPAEDGPLLAVVDGRARVREWAALRELGHWSGVLALHAEATPPRPADRSVPELVAGAERVDLAAALRALGEREGVETVRVDSGGALTGALLTAGLLDEVSLLVHPCLPAEPTAHRWHGSAAAARFTLVESRPLDGGLVWLRYRPAD
ncbi:RibD family protein [Allonocardiopsis opalescens]|uniref:2,5-diamino-6-(Ribosylamino)-4(3H)-pyrimidinone 5'-phosphate reductase n=1 Tax=Allonocardiopsis opalescens TaxID=1144618 RepID=A0A2T0Q6U9_9ACTN|nr:dihydrofolate reductase family protein [Allonocardiopsis opalescens]PRX99535.1 2,5-diamino-6-(ribosylamino)-4(3H)-pyrimidinone 5'-phosphate reductase [Allonocardiopsis opalescens]